MPTEVRIAVAGSGKTAAIVEHIQAQEAGASSLAITYTINGQNEIRSRVAANCRGEFETLGWYSFLLSHIVRPYLPLLFPGVVPYGIHFVEGQAKYRKGRGGWRYYFDDELRPYSDRLAVLAKKVLKVSKMAPIARLEAIYDSIYIDEFQDLNGNDLEVLDALMGSKISILITGDVRQTVLSTSKSDQMNKAYRGIKVVNWYKKKAAAKRCVVVYSSESSRFNQQIADFSDLIHDPDHALPSTISVAEHESNHDGVFLVSTKQVNSYLAEWDVCPTILSYQSTTIGPSHAERITFGKSKGLTRDRVLIVATNPIVKLLTKRTLLAELSAAGFYVATTRARFSVAILVEDASEVHENLHEDFAGKVQIWTA